MHLHALISRLDPSRIASSRSCRSQSGVVVYCKSGLFMSKADARAGASNERRACCADERRTPTPLRPALQKEAFLCSNSWWLGLPPGEPEKLRKPC